MIRWIAGVTGTGTVFQRPSGGKNLVAEPKNGYKDAWVWQLYGRNAALLLTQLLPYLKVKREKAEAMITQVAAGDNGDSDLSPDAPSQDPLLFAEE